MPEPLIQAIEALLVSQPFAGRRPELIATGDMADDEFVARFLQDRSDNLLIAVVDGSIVTEHGDSERDVMELTLGLFLSAPTAGSQWATFVRLHEHLRAVVHADPTAGGQAIELSVGDAEVGPDFNSSRTWVDTTLIVRYEAA